MVRTLKLNVLCVLTGALAGCTTSGVVDQANAPETVPVERAMVVPPPGGPSIVSVVEHRRGNGVDQSVALYTSSSVPGQNVFKIRYLAKSGTTPNAESVSYKMVTEGGLAREAQREVSTVRMARSTVYLQNAYGPFSYASGRSSSGDTCIYAWQQIRASRDAQTQARNFGMIQIRLRLCDRHADERQLLGVMYGYTIAGLVTGEVWNPFGPPPAVSSTLGQTGAPIYPDASGYRPMPMPMGYEPAPARPAARAPRRVTVRPAPPVRQSAPAPAMPEPVGPKVPIPMEEPGPGVSDATGTPRPAAAASARGFAVPSPDCMGDARTAACVK